MSFQGYGKEFLKYGDVVMTVVIICSLDKLHAEISVIEQRHKTNQDFRWIAPVLTDFFLESEHSKSLFTHKYTGIYSFTVERFKQCFDQYILSEISRSPGDVDKVRKIEKLILSLFESEWPIKSNLVVWECLDDDDKNLQPSPV
jgi:hypothetical protein